MPYREIGYQLTDKYDYQGIALLLSRHFHHCLPLRIGHRLHGKSSYPDQGHTGQTFIRFDLSETNGLF